MIRLDVKEIEWDKSSISECNSEDEISDPHLIALVSDSRCVSCCNVNPKILSHLTYKSFIRCSGDILRVVDSAFDFKKLFIHTETKCTKLQETLLCMTEKYDNSKTELTQTINDYNELLDDYNTLEREHHNIHATKHVSDSMTTLSRTGTNTLLCNLQNQESTVVNQVNMHERKTVDTSTNTEMSKTATVSTHTEMSKTATVSTNTEMSIVDLENIDKNDILQYQQQEIMFSCLTKIFKQMSMVQKYVKLLTVDRRKQLAVLAGVSSVLADFLSTETYGAVQTSHDGLSSAKSLVYHVDKCMYEMTTLQIQLSEAKMQIHTLQRRYVDTETEIKNILSEVRNLNITHAKTFGSPAIVNPQKTQEIPANVLLTEVKTCKHNFETLRCIMKDTQNKLRKKELEMDERIMEQDSREAWFLAESSLINTQVSKLRHILRVLEDTLNPGAGESHRKEPKIDSVSDNVTQNLCIFRECIASCQQFNTLLAIFTGIVSKKIEDLQQNIAEYEHKLQQVKKNENIQIRKLYSNPLKLKLTENVCIESREPAVEICKRCRQNMITPQNINNSIHSEIEGPDVLSLSPLSLHAFDSYVTDLTSTVYDIESLINSQLRQHVLEIHGALTDSRITR